MTDAPKLNPLYDDGLPMSCRECYWYVGNLLTGLCHGKPRTPLVIGALTDVAGNIIGPRIAHYWSETGGDDYCAVFKPDRDRDLPPIIAVTPVEIQPEEAA